jgi:hypothetical protein
MASPSQALEGMYLTKASSSYSQRCELSAGPLIHAIVQAWRLCCPCLGAQAQAEHKESCPRAWHRVWRLSQRRPGVTFVLTFQATIDIKKQSAARHGWPLSLAAYPSHPKSARGTLRAAPNRRKGRLPTIEASRRALYLDLGHVLENFSTTL